MTCRRQPGATVCDRRFGWLISSTSRSAREANRGDGQGGQIVASTRTVLMGASCAGEVCVRCAEGDVLECVCCRPIKSGLQTHPNPALLPPIPSPPPSPTPTPTPTTRLLHLPTTRPSTHSHFLSISTDGVCSALLAPRLALQAKRCRLYGPSCWATSSQAHWPLSKRRILLLQPATSPPKQLQASRRPNGRLVCSFAGR